MYKRVAIDSALSDDNGEIDVRHRDGWPSTSGSNSIAPFTTVSRGIVVDKRVEFNSALGDGAQADTRYVGEQATLCGTARLARTRIAPLTDVVRQPRSPRAES